MRRVIKYISFLVIVLVLFHSDLVFGATTITSSCNNNTVCQYKNNNTKEVKNNEVLITWDAGKNQSPNKYEIIYHRPNNDMTMVGADGLYVNEMVSYHTNLHTFDQLVRDGYADFINFDNDLDKAIETKKFCSKYAYQLKKEKKIWGTCFDDDGKACKKKYGDKIIDTFNLNQDDFTRCADGKVEVTNEGTTTKEKAEKRVIDNLKEQKIVLEEKKINPGSDCVGIFGEKVTEDINIALKYIKYIGPVLVVVLGILDFIKAVASGANDEFNKAWKRLLTRLIVAILLFFVVDLIKFLFHVFGITVPDHCLK